MRAALLLLCASCGGAATPTVQVPERPRWEGELVDLIPADARAVIVARPAELWTEAATHRVIESIANDAQLERYRQHTGIDPRTLRELVWAELEQGSVLIVRGPFNAELAVAEMGERMLPIESRSEAPFVRRTGHYQHERRDLVALGDGVLLAITASPDVADAVMSRVRGEDDAPGALETLSVAPLVATRRGAPLMVVAPHPLGLPLDSGVGMLLARERALLATAHPMDVDTITLWVDLEGEFPAGAEENFRHLIASLADSDLGSALGMRDVLATLTVESTDSGIVLRGAAAAATVAMGLRVLFDAEISELVDLSPNGSTERVIRP